MLVPDVFDEHICFPFSNDSYLFRVFLPVNELVLEVVGQRENEPVWNCSGSHAEDLASWVDQTKVPCLTAVVTGLERTNEGLALVFIHEV